MFPHRVPPEACLRHRPQSDPSDSSGPNQDLDNVILNHADVTFSFDEDMQPGLSTKTIGTQKIYQFTTQKD